jgi:hypothetical protein
MSVNHTFYKIDAIRREIDEDVKDRFMDNLSNLVEFHDLIEYDIRGKDGDEWEEIKETIRHSDEMKWTATTAMDWKGFPFALWDNLYEIMDSYYDCLDEEDAEMRKRIPCSYSVLDYYADQTIKAYADGWVEEFIEEAREQIKIKMNERPIDDTIEYDACDEWQTCPCSNAKMIRMQVKEKEEREAI